MEIPLAELGFEGSPDINRVFFQNGTGADVPTFYVDDIKLTTAYASHVVFVSGSPAPVITGATFARGEVNDPFSYTLSATNDPSAFSATGLPAGLAIDANTGVISGAPTEAGVYQVTIAATNASGEGTASLVIDVAPAPVVITFPEKGPFNAALTFAYDGTAKAADVSTEPADVPVTIAYDGRTSAPRLPGSYQVVVTSNDPNYTGSAEATLLITATALVRHAPVLNGAVDGSIQVIFGESFAMPGTGSVSGDLLLPGTPTVRLNGHPVLAGVVDEAGAAAPSDYSVTLNGGAVVRYVARRVDPIVLPSVVAPTAPNGTRDVTLSRPGQSAGDFRTLRNLTLNGNAGSISAPAGVYGHFTVNGNNRLVLGVVGGIEPAIYELQSLTVNGTASVEMVGPVRLKLARGTWLNSTVGSAEHPEWLDLQIAAGGLTLNGNARLHGVVTAPNGAVIVNGELRGRVNADRLTINDNGLLSDPAE